MEGRATVIVGNGEPPPRALLLECLAGQPLILCADGGANVVWDAGHVPDWVVGDLDSVRPEVLARVPAPHRVRVDADDTGTDLQKVLHQALDLGVREAVLLGFTGRRVDHTLWNLGLLKAYGDCLALRLVDAHCDVRLIGAGIRFRAAIGQKLSLCPLSGPVAEITTHGLRWPLKGEALAPGVKDGISNEVVANPVEIAVGSGDLLLCLQREAGGGRIQVL
ncbi:MAG: thiamine diphosphokinase [Gemmatimonadota bacterium]